MSPSPAPPTRGLPTTADDLVYALLPSIAEDLIGELAGGTNDPQIVRKLAAGTATPSIHGLLRLRVAFEVSKLLTEAGMSPAEIQAWWMTDGALNAVGEDDSPVGVMRYHPLKEAASKILKVARVASGSTAAPYTWDPLVLLLLDVDGCLLPFSEWHSEVHTEDFQPLDFSEPPFSERRFYFDPDVIAAVTHWAADEGVLLNWLTSWGPVAPRLLAPQLGLPDIGTFATRTDHDIYRQRPWKRLALWGFLSEGLPPRNPIRIVAIDDADMSGAGKQLRGMRSEKLLDSLVIEPRSSVGLTAVQIAQVDEFIARGQVSSTGEVVDEPRRPRPVFLRTAADVAAEVRTSRKTLAWSLDQLAVMARVKLGTLERLEAGGMLAEDLEAVVRTLEALGLDPVALPGIASTVKIEDVDLNAHMRKFE